MIGNSVDATWSSIGTGLGVSDCVKVDLAPSEQLNLALAPSQAQQQKQYWYLSQSVSLRSTDIRIR